MPNVLIDSTGEPPPPPRPSWPLAILTLDTNALEL